MSTRHKRKRPRYYVATYGEMGMDVEFYSTEKEYDEAMAEAEAGWKRDNFDTYTGGEVSL